LDALKSMKINYCGGVGQTTSSGFENFCGMSLKAWRYSNHASLDGFGEASGKTAQSVFFKLKFLTILYFEFV